MQAVFTGFDSAWGRTQNGSVCDLLLVGNSLELPSEPKQVDWESALKRARQRLDVDLQVWAIDQPLLVSNIGGCRPVERDLARALMADFGCGAHSSNRTMAAFADDAPIWSLLRALELEGYLHRPMAVPDAKRSRFYFECYPHPAVIGLFDLERILNYKVHRKNLADWLLLIRLLRSLASAALPIRNIEKFVPENLPQNKRNEDNLDALISAYTAAYWWRFGVQRSTMIGDLSTGYIVTPHSLRTLERLKAAFGHRMNLDGTAVPPANPIRNRKVDTVRDTPLPYKTEEGDNHPACDWVYFATPARWSLTVTSDFVATHKVIVRNVHNAAGQRVANVRHLKAGERILLAYGGRGRPYRALFSGRISASAAPPRTSRFSFDVFACLDDALSQELQAGGYVRDPVIRKFTGIAISDIQNLRNSGGSIPRPPGNNTLWRSKDVFGKP